MAVPDHFAGSKLLIKIGDGASPETFAHPCLINAERGISFSATTEDSDIPDCDNPDDPSWTGREKSTLSAEISGSGIMDAADTDEYFDWFKSSTPKNVQVVVDSGGDNEKTYQGSFHLTAFELTGPRRARVTNSITLVSDGAVVDIDD